MSYGTNINIINLQLIEKTNVTTTTNFKLFHSMQKQVGFDNLKTLFYLLHNNIFRKMKYSSVTG